VGTETGLSGIVSGVNGAAHKTKGRQKYKNPAHQVPSVGGKERARSPADSLSLCLLVTVFFSCSRGFGRRLIE